MNSISDQIKHLGINQIDSALIMKVTQPRISDLSRGRISDFTLDRLFRMNERINNHIVLTQSS